MYHRYLFLLFAGIVILLNSRCSGNDRTQYESPEGYDLNKPFIFNLPIELDEISGIVFYPKDTTVFAINDEFGWLYKIRFTGNMTINKWKFSDGADFEDLAMIDSIFYVLQSNGNVVTFTFGDSGTIYRHESQFPSKGNEFEILYYDSTKSKISLICKDCDSDKKKSLTQFTFDPANKIYSDSAQPIDVRKIAIMMGEKNLKFKPSAAAIHPITGELYIISAVNDLLVITDKQGNPRISYRINGTLFKQPEGLAFTPAGDLLISNEAADRGVANILLFKYQKKPQL